MQTALLVEDHEVTRQWLAEMITAAFGDIHVVTASTLEGGRHALQSHHFNLALIDISLPDGNGIDLIREITRHSPETYCVVATIYDDDEHLFSALQAGAQGYLVKEQAKDQLLTRLKGILNGDPPLTPAIARRVLRHFRAQDKTSPAVRLSERETEVLTLIAKGYARGEIAELLGITKNTAASYIKKTYQKLNVSTRAEAALKAARLGLVNTDIETP